MRRVRVPLSPPGRARKARLGALLGSFLVLIAAAACERPPVTGLQLTKVGFAELPGWRDDAVAEALPALRRSCDRLLAAPPDRPLGPDGLAGTVADWRGPCRAIAELPEGDDGALRKLLESRFVPFRVADGIDPDGLFTGYYEPVLDGARVSDGPYRWPLYRRPGDLVRVDLGRFGRRLDGRRLVGRVADGALVPYYTRAEIDGGALDGCGCELVWVDDPVDAFFLHVQGSGRVRLRDGGAMRVGYAASNGHDFTGIGRLLLERGDIAPEQASMQAIRDWLRAHPGRAREVMQENARYIFFRPIDGPGPIGAQGVALTAGRSLAVDPARLPLGAPLWLDTTWPASERPLRRLMVAQDTGSAIKGVVRGDVYFGSGEAALEHAGRMAEQGRYYLLLPEAAAERRRLAS